MSPADPKDGTLVVAVCHSPDHDTGPHRHGNLGWFAQSDPVSARPETINVEAINGTLLHRAWLKSGRPDPLIDSDAWDGFALTIQAVARMERITNKPGDACTCGAFAPDSSGDAGCGNCGADYPPLEQSHV
jgi:hypothetical protein